MSEITVEVKCLFCGEPMKEDSTTKMIKCHNCGEINNYDDMVDKAVNDAGNNLMKKISDDFDKKMEKVGFKKR